MFQYHQTQQDNKHKTTHLLLIKIKIVKRFINVAVVSSTSPPRFWEFIKFSQFDNGIYCYGIIDEIGILFPSYTHKN